MKIAVSGKGGVGKTLIAGGLACYFANRGLKTIAIDADTSPNLALTLGLQPEEARQIIPVSENKELIKSKTDIGDPNVFRLTFTVDDIVREYSVRTPYGVSLIVMGTVKSAGSGCACPANAVIRTLLRHLVVERDEAIVVDMEAGIEHFGRGTAQHVDTMLIITDANMKSLEIARNINELAKGAGIKQIVLIGNRIGNETQAKVVEDFAEKSGIKILDFVPFDQKVSEAEMRGETPLGYGDSEFVRAVEKLGEKLAAEE